MLVVVERLSAPAEPRRVAAGVQQELGYRTGRSHRRHVCVIGW